MRLVGGRIKSLKAAATEAGATEAARMTVGDRLCSTKAGVVVPLA